MRQSSYEKAVALLDDDYGEEKNTFVKTEKFVLVSQLAGEGTRDYVVRGEQLCRDAGFHDADALRRCYYFVLPVSGLRDTNLQMELVAKRGLDWKKLKKLLRPDQWQRTQLMCLLEISMVQFLSKKRWV